MFHGRGGNNKINHFHEHLLRTVYTYSKSSFKNLLKKDNSFTVDHTNFQSLATKLSKVKENISNTIIMKDILQTKTLTYNLMLQTDFMRTFVNTSRFGLNTLHYFASKVWNIVPSDIKNANNLHIFENKKGIWEHEECNCDLCRLFVSNLGFVKLVEIGFN